MKEERVNTREALAQRVLKGDATASIAFLIAVPPANVHAMQRDSLWIGDIYSSDLVVSSLSSADVTFKAGMKMLNFGGSSGSLVRILAAVYPKVNFVSCDRVKSSISWAQKFLKWRNLQFVHIGQRPLLPFHNGEFDIVSAISIWSHHGINASKLWFDEIARIMRPGGVMVLTTHGLGSILHYTEQALKPLIRYKQIYATYLAPGFVFEEVWIGHDDVGNVATELE